MRCIDTDILYISRCFCPQETIFHLLPYCIFFVRKSQVNNNSNKKTTKISKNVNDLFFPVVVLWGGREFYFL